MFPAGGVAEAGPVVELAAFAAGRFVDRVVDTLLPPESSRGATLLLLLRNTQVQLRVTLVTLAIACYSKIACYSCWVNVWCKRIVTDGLVTHRIPGSATVAVAVLAPPAGRGAANVVLREGEEVESWFGKLNLDWAIPSFAAVCSAATDLRGWVADGSEDTGSRAANESTPDCRELIVVGSSAGLSENNCGCNDANLSVCAASFSALCSASISAPSCKAASVISSLGLAALLY